MRQNSFSLARRMPWSGQDVLHLSVFIIVIYFKIDRNEAINFETNQAGNRAHTPISSTLHQSMGSGESAAHSMLWMLERKRLWRWYTRSYATATSITITVEWGTAVQNLSDNECRWKRYGETSLFSSVRSNILFPSSYTFVRRLVYIGCTYSGRVQPMETVAEFQSDWFGQDHYIYLLPAGQAMVFHQHSHSPLPWYSAWCSRCRMNRLQQAFVFVPEPMWIQFICWLLFVIVSPFAASRFSHTVLFMFFVHFAVCNVC